MPIKKHVVNIGKDNTVKLPKSLCDAYGIGENVPVRVFANTHQIVIEPVPTFQALKEIEFANAKIAELTDKLIKMEAKVNG